MIGAHFKHALILGALLVKRMDDLPDELGIKDPRPTYAVVRRRLRALGVVLKPYGITFHCLRTGTGSVVLNFFAR
jgi:hypothetical protein